MRGAKLVMPQRTKCENYGDSHFQRYIGHGLVATATWARNTKASQSPGAFARRDGFAVLSEMPPVRSASWSRGISKRTKHLCNKAPHETLGAQTHTGNHID